MAKYFLPFKKGMAKISHPLVFENLPEAKYALNFQVKKGMPVTAARDGQVAETKSGPIERVLETERLESVHKTDYVILNHKDGTFAQYLHLTPTVKIGQEVKARDIIGYTTGGDPQFEPHLHFNVFKLVNNKALSVPISFEKRL